jgi:Rrf2 family transcriptional regulator, iron-sulfur cluster assembly transcription factor
MQVSLGRRGDYAVRAALHLAGRAAGDWCKARDIADGEDIPAAYLPQVLGDLVRRGIVRSRSGPNGGYQLARPAAEVSLLEVIEAAGGPVRSRICVLRGVPCQGEDACAVHEAWTEAQLAMIERLRSADLASLVARTAVGVPAGSASGVLPPAAGGGDPKGP